MINMEYRVIFSVVPSKRLRIKIFKDGEIEKKLIRIRKEITKNYDGYTIYGIDDWTYIIDIFTDKKEGEVKEFVKKMGRTFKQENVILMVISDRDKSKIDLIKTA